MSDALAAFNVLEVQVTAGLPGPPGSRGTNGADGSPDTPYFAASASRSRNSIDRAGDRINIKDDAVGNGVSESAAIAAWIARATAGYSHGTSSNVAATAKGLYIPGGLFDAGTPTTLATGGFGYSIFGDGRASQLENVTLETKHVNTRIRDFAIIGDGTGRGLDIQSSNLIAQNIDLQNHDIAIAASRGSSPGVAAPNNTVAFGSLRSSRIGAKIMNNDVRLMFLRTAFLTECGIDCRDAGGYHLLGNNIFCDTGPAIRWTGGNFTFTGDVELGSFVIENISDFTNIEIDDIVTSAGNLSSTTRVTEIDEPGGTITVDRAALNTVVGANLAIVRIPIESFYVDNTFNAGRTDLLEFEIDSITDAGGGQIRVVTVNQNFKLSLGTNRIRFEDTGVAAYDDNSAPQERWITAIEDWNTVLVNVPYVSDVTGVGVMKANNYDSELSTGTSANSYVREHFFVGNNFNQSLWQGGVAFNFIGTRLASRITFDGFRPFRGTASIGSPVVTGITGINTNELREGVIVTTSTASFPVGTVIESVDSATQITLSEDATENAVNTLFTSQHSPNGFFHVALIDNNTMVDMGVTQPSGPGCLLGWAQISMFPDFDPSYAPAEGGYWSGIRAPYTQGGMLNGQAQYLNELGVMNTGIHIKSNSVRHFLRGSEWVLNDNRTFVVASVATANAGASILLTMEQTCPLVVGVDRVYLTGTSVVGYDNVEAVVEAKPRPDQIQLPIAFVSDATGTLNTDASMIIFREGAPVNASGGASDAGVNVIANGRPMVVEARAYRNNGGTLYGNSMFRLRAPRSGTAVNDYAPGGGFMVLAGDSGDNISHFFLGSAAAAVDLTGNAASIQGLSTGTVEIRDDGVTNWHFGSTTPWASISRTGNSLITSSSNAARRFIFSNENTGTAAEANVEVRQAAGGSTTAVRMAVYSTGFTTAGLAVQDGGAVYSESALSGGLTVGTLAGDLRLRPTGSLSFGTHSAIGAETVTGFITITDAAGNSRKLAVVS